MDYWSPEEFLEKLSIHNRIINRRRKTPNLYRSWILFYERVLVNDVVRLAVQNDGHKFWEKDPSFRFRFRFQLILGFYLEVKGNWLNARHHKIFIIMVIK